MSTAHAADVERVTMWRVNHPTVIEAPVHAPTDSTLLLDSVRVMVRLLTQTEQPMPALARHNHSRRAKNRTRAIRHIRCKAKKKALYQDLAKVTQAKLGYLEAAAVALKAANRGELRWAPDAFQPQLLRQTGTQRRPAILRCFLASQRKAHMLIHFRCK